MMTEYIYIDDNGSGVKPKQKLRKFYHSECQDTYGNRGQGPSQDATFFYTRTHLSEL